MGRNQEEADQKLEKVKEACKDKKVVEEFIDLPKGWRLNGKRSGLEKLKRRAKWGVIDSVHLYQFEDFSTKLFRVVQAVKYFKKHKVKTFSLSENETGKEFLEGLELVFGEI